MIEVCLLGCGGSMPVPNRALTSLILSFNGHKLLIDCGEGTQVSMKKIGTGFKKIDTICLTHYHADHCLGLPGLLLTIANSGRCKPLNIIGPIGLKEIIKGLLVVAPELPYALNLIEVRERETAINLGDISIKTMSVEHSIPCIGYSIETIRSREFDPKKAMENQIPKKLWGKLQKGESVQFEGKVFIPEMVLLHKRKGIKVTYVTDTRPIREIAEFAKAADLFICEGMYGEDTEVQKAIKNRHMTFNEAAKLAKLSEAKKLWLTHFSPSLTEPENYIEAVRKIFLNSYIGEDRLCTSINYED